jgi:hypothetical protein
MRSWIGCNVQAGLADVMNVTYGRQVETGYMGPWWNVGWDGGGGWCSNNCVVGHRLSTFSTNHNIAHGGKQLFILLASLMLSCSSCANRARCLALSKDAAHLQRSLAWPGEISKCCATTYQHPATHSSSWAESLPSIRHTDPCKYSRRLDSQDVGPRSDIDFSKDPLAGPGGPGGSAIPASIT